MLYYVIFIELSSISYFAGSLALTYRLVSLANFCYYLGLPDQKAFVTTAHCDSFTVCTKYWRHSNTTLAENNHTYSWSKILVNHTGGVLILKTWKYIDQSQWPTLKPFRETFGISLKSSRDIPLAMRRSCWNRFLLLWFVWKVRTHYQPIIFLGDRWK